MKIYHYDRVTQEYTGFTEAKPDPMVKDRFLVPANATEIKPNDPIQGFAQVFVKDAWVDVPDHRGVLVESPDGQVFEITELGTTPSDVEFEPLPEKTYQEKRLEKYPPIGDQLDAIMKWLATETEFQVPHELKSLAMKCMSVKAQVPKE